MVNETSEFSSVALANLALNLVRLARKICSQIGWTHCALLIPRLVPVRSHSCGWMRPRRPSTRCCGCSCSKSWSCWMPTRARLRSTRTPSTNGRWRTWSRGCRSAERCWSKGYGHLQAHLCILNTHLIHIKHCPMNYSTFKNDLMVRLF